MTPPLRIPLMLEEITPEWLEHALGAGQGALRSLRIERIGGNAGIIGVLFRVQLEWGSNDSLPATVVVKLTGNEPETVARVRRAFEREITFYRELAGVCGARTPLIHWAGQDDASGVAAIVMEDLGRGTIYESGAAPVSALDAICRAMAAVHARWWNDAQLASFAWLVTDDAMARQLGPRIRQSLPLARVWYERNFPALLPLAELLPDAMEGGLLANTGPRTLIHGDLGLKNTAFLDGEVVLFDWQLAGWRTPGADLAELVKDGFGEFDPSALATRLLAIEHDALQAAGVPEATREMLRDGFVRRVAMGIGTPAVLLSVPNPGLGRESNARR
jgi:Phosphotransferase enzyme family